MSKKGEDKTLKTLNAPKIRAIHRKESVFSIKVNKGPHTSDSSVPISFILRDLLGYSSNLKETKFILNTGKVKVDGKTVKDYRFPVGLFDLIDLPERKERFRVLLDLKGRIKLVSVDSKEKISKLCKVVGKKVYLKGKIQLITNDGRTIVLDKTDVNVGDSVKLDLPGQKIVQSFALEKGSQVFFTGGKHVGGKAEIIEIIPGTMKRKSSVILIEGDKKFSTVLSNVFVVGKNKLEIELN